MKLIRQRKLFFKEGNSDKIYEVEISEIAGNFVVNFRYGRRGTTLKEGTKTTSPVSRNQAETIFEKLIAEKTKKGYQFSDAEFQEKKPLKETVKKFDANQRKENILNLLDNLTKPQTFVGKVLDTFKGSSKKKAGKIERLIWRTGELKIKEATPFLLKLFETDNFLRKYCCLWALGFCGDVEILPKLTTVAEADSSPDALKRIAREAIFKIADEQTKNFWREKSVNKLPQELRTAWDTQSPDVLTQKVKEILEIPRRTAFDELETLYEINDEVCRLTLLRILPEILLKPKFFRPLRHIFKIAEYRRDAQIFGIVVKLFETQQANFIYYYNYEWKEVDGKWKKLERADGLTTETSNFAFGNATKNYFINRSWRTLRRLGEIEDSDFVKMAVGVLLPYSDEDAQQPKTSTYYNYIDENGQYNWRNPQKNNISWDKFSQYFLFNQLLYKNSPRYELKLGTRFFRCRKSYKVGNPSPDFREEAFPKLWEKQPMALLHLIAESRCQEVHEFAVKALRDCHDFCKELPPDAVLMILKSPYQISAKLGFELAKVLHEKDKLNAELVLAVILCEYQEARNEAFRWIDENRDFFSKQFDLLLNMLIGKHGEVRQFAGNLLLTSVYSNEEKQTLVIRLIAEMFAFTAKEREQAIDLGKFILQIFSEDCRRLSLDVVRDLLSHQLLEVQEFGGNILLNHEISAEKLPDDLIKSLISSTFAEIRAIGMSLFAKLPEENLFQRESLIASFLANELEDIHLAVRPLVKNLATKNKTFGENLTRRIVVLLLQGQLSDEIEERVFFSLRHDIPNFADFIDYETAQILLSAKSPKAVELSGLVSEIHAEEWFVNFSTADIIQLTNNEVLSVRQASWKLAENSLAKFIENSESEIPLLIRALDSKWEDSREFWIEFFRTKFTEKQLSPEILVAICDSVKPEVQKFGRDLIQTYLRNEDGVEYLLKLSEHPSPEMSLFVTNYLEEYIADSPEKIGLLETFFVRVLSLVNRSRIAKNRILLFLESEALKNELSAQIISRILARQSATSALKDKAQMIESMLKIRRKFPQTVLPIEVKNWEVRKV